MKKIILLVLALMPTIMLFAQEKEVKYIDATELNIIGKALPSSDPYARVNLSGYGFDNEGIIRYSGYPTGLMVLFKTDSREIYAKWRTSKANSRPNMNAILQKGLDLYIRKDGEWVFAGVGVPDMSKAPHNKHGDLIVADMDTGEKECLLYLPIFDRLESLEIGVNIEASICPMENPFRHKVVFCGSSITHGASASRPGMTFPARFGRDNGLDVVNLGFSGRYKMQKGFAHLVADMDADVFVFDPFSNPEADEIYDRFNDFVDIIRKAHPYTPLIFLQTERQELRNFSVLEEKNESAKQDAARTLVTERMKTDKHIYFIDSKDFLGDEHIATVDGTHPTDLGFTYMLDSMSPEILSILSRYGITPDGKSFTLAHYNIGAIRKNADSSVRTISDVLKELQPDVVSLNEVDSCTTRTGRVDQLSELASQMGEWNSHYGAAFPFQGGAYGVGVMSRPEMRILKTDRVSLPKLTGGEARAVSVVEYEDMVFASTHIDYKSVDVQKAQIEIINNYMDSLYRSSSKPVFLCGDFNFEPDSPSMELMKESWSLLSPEDYTFPSHAPIKCIDYIFVRPQGRTVKVKKTVIPHSLQTASVATVSDHLPVAVTVCIE